MLSPLPNTWLPLALLLACCPVAHADEPASAIQRGLERVRAGAWAEGRALLQPLLERAAKSDRPAILAALGLAAVRLRDEPAARRHLEALARETDRDSERAYARQLLAELATPRASIGLAVPLSGQYRAAGTAVVSGAVAGAAGLALLVGAEGDAAAAARRLIDHRVPALVGALGPEAAAVGRVAAARGVPLLALTCTTAATTFCLLPDGAARARALASRAVKALAGRRFAVLAPDTVYGRAMAAAFGSALPDGANVVKQLLYPAATASFAAAARTLAAGPRFDALFVPDEARALALIAPALAGAGLSSADVARRGRRRSGRPIHILATADGATAQLAESAGRYLQGATLAPGFFPDPQDPRAGARLRAFIASHGRPPGLVEALAADGAALLAKLVEGGATSPAALLAALRAGRALTGGLTGELRFGASGARADPPLLYRVSGEKIGRSTD